jgi:hypothetical protein
VVKLGDLDHRIRIFSADLMEEGESRYCARELFSSPLQGEGALDPYKADVFSLGSATQGDEMCVYVCTCINASFSIDNFPLHL